MNGLPRALLPRPGPNRDDAARTAAAGRDEFGRGVGRAGVDLDGHDGPAVDQFVDIRIFAVTARRPRPDRIDGRAPGADVLPEDVRRESPVDHEVHRATATSRDNRSS